MKSLKTIKLISAAALLFGSMVIVGVSLNKGGTAAKNPITRKIRRPYDKRKLPASAAEVAELRKQVQEEEKRKLKTREFKDMPLSVHKVRNLESDTWYNDLEIEVKNISNKPIYAILVYLKFPDVKVPLGVSGITMDYGLRKYIDISVLADPADPHLNPGETCVFRIKEQYKRGLRWKQEHIPEQMKKFVLHFGVISFGDGTGFAFDLPTDYRIKHSQTEEKKKHHPGRLEKSASTRSPPQDGCGSCGRYVIKPEPEIICWDTEHDQPCEGQRATTSAAARCSLIVPGPIDCDGDGIEECNEDEIYYSPSCPGYSPTPPPTPSPSPTPTPSASPTPTPCPPTT